MQGGGYTSSSSDARDLESFATGAQHIERRRIAPDEYFHELARYRFLLAPHGKGVTSPKFMEAILLMTIPITKRFAAFEDYIAYGLPIVVVDAWDEVTPEALERWWAELSPRLEAARWAATNDGYRSLLFDKC